MKNVYITNLLLKHDISIKELNKNYKFIRYFVNRKINIVNLASFS